MPRAAAAVALTVAALGVVAAPAGAVVGGTPARPSASPWFAELPFCGGALIAPDRVATAAHCVAGLPLRDIPRVTFGSGSTRGARAIAVHPRYVRRALTGSTTARRPPTTSRWCCSTRRSPTSRH